MDALAFEAAEEGVRVFVGIDGDPVRRLGGLMEARGIRSAELRSTTRRRISFVVTLVS